ncbi:hypothetical protein NKH60_24590, partial [Mesorhizobium sp. M1006]
PSDDTLPRSLDAIDERHGRRLRELDQRWLGFQGKTRGGILGMPDNDFLEIFDAVGDAEVRAPTSELSGDAFHAANSATKRAVSPFTDAHLSSPLFPNTIIAVPVTSIDRSAIVWLTLRKKPQGRFCSMFASTAIAAFSGWLRLDMAFKS